MKILFRAQATSTPAEFRERMARRVRLALGRHGPRIRTVSVRLVDVNGPRGGVDLRCRMVATLRGSGQVFAEAAGADPFEAGDVALERLARAAARALADRRSPRAPLARAWAW